MTAAGIALSRNLPSGDFEVAWDAIKIDAAIKERLVAQALMTLNVRQKVAFETAPLHGLVLLQGPLGTGKTTLARGLANAVAKFLPKGTAKFVQVDPHALANAALGKSQQAEEFGRLVNVSVQTVYGWKNEKSSPRSAQMLAIASLRKIGKREARAWLDSMTTA